jgi:hypothetical protein
VRWLGGSGTHLIVRAKTLAMCGRYDILRLEVLALLQAVRKALDDPGVAPQTGMQNLLRAIICSLANWRL